jgi:hypothetical protein
VTSVPDSQDDRADVAAIDVIRVLAEKRDGCVRAVGVGRIVLFSFETVAINFTLWLFVPMLRTTKTM